MDERKELSLTDTHSENIRQEAYNKGLEAGKQFAAYYCLSAVHKAPFNKNRSSVSKNVMCVGLDEVLDHCAKIFGVDYKR